MLTMLLISVALAAHASEPTPPKKMLEDGVYEAVAGNNTSICPQVVKAIHDEENGRLTALEVLYVGDCYRQGPYEYYCADELIEAGQPERQLVCWSPLEIRFVVRTPTSYRWENVPYEIWGELELKKERNFPGLRR